MSSDVVQAHRSGAAANKCHLRSTRLASNVKWWEFHREDALHSRSVAPVTCLEPQQRFRRRPKQLAPASKHMDHPRTRPQN